MKFSRTRGLRIDDPTKAVQGFSLPRREWKTVNRLRTGNGCCAEKMFLWGFANSPVCDCDNLTIQSISYIINDCPIRRFNGDIIMPYMHCRQRHEIGLKTWI